jgi:hypothetical protein
MRRTYVCCGTNLNLGKQCFSKLHDIFDAGASTVCEASKNFDDMKTITRMHRQLQFKKRSKEAAMHRRKQVLRRDCAEETNLSIDRADFLSARNASHIIKTFDATENVMQSSMLHSSYQSDSSSSWTSDHSVMIGRKRNLRKNINVMCDTGAYKVNVRQSKRLSNSRLGCADNVNHTAKEFDASL